MLLGQWRMASSV